LAWHWLDVLISDAAYHAAIPFGDFDNLTLEVERYHGALLS